MPASDAPTSPVVWQPIEFPAPCPWHLLDGRQRVFFWQDGPEGDAWFALGRSGSFPSLDACRRELQKLQALTDFPLRAFAVAAFDPSRAMGGPWKNFPAHEILLPLLLIRWRGGMASGLVYVTPGSKASAVSMQGLLSGINGHINATGPVEGMTERSLFPRDAWHSAVDRIRNRIAEGSLQKAVLSRQVQFTAGLPFAASAILEKLAAAGDGSILFAHRPDDASDVFVGMTPERLFSQRHDHIVVDSLAGTRPRGGDPVDDERLEQELVRSAKDRHEQELVTRHIAAQLQPFCSDMNMGAAPRVSKLATVQHLYTSIEARLQPQVSLDRLLALLHPTPATSGYPVAAARDLIAQLEPEARGLYAGVVGWIGAEHAEFAVAIRSGLIQSNSIRLFGGAGIVAASDPDAEYEECSWKMEPLRRVL